MAAMGFLAAGFLWWVGRRGQREIAAIQRGEYLAHWRYGPGGIASQAREQRARIIRQIVWTLVIVLVGGGLILGGIGAYMKSSLHTLWQLPLLAGVAALMVAAPVVVLTWLLKEVRIASRKSCLLR